MEPAIIAGLVWIPYRYYTRESASAVMQRLTAHPKGFEGKTRAPIPYWTKCDERKMVGLPVEFGMQQIRELGIPDNLIANALTEGDPVSYAKTPTPRNEKQAEFFDSILTQLEDNYTLLAVAPTGSGKSVAALNALGALSVRGLIIVDSVVLANQWVKEVKLHLGVTDAEIGMVQGTRCDYRGKKVVVAVIHNLVQKDFDPAFYDHFGFVVWDEGQILGAESFSKSLGLFPARYRLTVSATPERKDGCTKMIYDHFGRERTRTTQEAIPCDVRVINYNKRHRVTKAPAATQINWLTQDQDRNELIVRVLLNDHAEFPPENGILCISDRIEHLQYLMEWCAISGIPRDKMGLFTRSYTDAEGRERTNQEPYLDWCKREARLIFGTFSMICKGVDIPRLISGVDATPRSSGIQAIGRVRRMFPGKTRSRWTTINDTGSGLFSSRTRNRLRDYGTDKKILITHNFTL